MSEVTRDENRKGVGLETGLWLTLIWMSWREILFMDSGHFKYSFNSIYPIFYYKLMGKIPRNLVRSSSKSVHETQRFECWIIAMYPGFAGCT